MKKYLLTIALLISVLGQSQCFGEEKWMIKGKNNPYVLMQNGSIKSEIAKGIEVAEPQDDWYFTYPIGNPVRMYGDGTTLVKRAFDGSRTWMWDLLSDGSYDVPSMHEGGQYYKNVMNTKRGIQRLNVFFDNGMPQYQIDYKSTELEIYELNGKKRKRTNVLKERYGNIISLLGSEPTQSELDVYNQYFKKKGFAK